MPKQTYKIGTIGEEVAIKHIQKETEISIIAKRYKSKIGEIDIIALDGSTNTLIFIEVKSTSGKNVDYENTITKRQWIRIFNAAEDFIAKNEIYSNHNQRFDSIFIINGKVANHFKNIVIDDFVDTSYINKW